MDFRVQALHEREVRRNRELLFSPAEGCVPLLHLCDSLQHCPVRGPLCPFPPHKEVQSEPAYPQVLLHQDSAAADSF